MAFDRQIALGLLIDHSKYTEGMKKAKQDTDGLKEAAKQASIGIDNFEKTAGKAGKTAKALGDELKKPTREWTELVKEVKKADTALGAVVSETKKAGKAAGEATNPIIKFKGSFSDLASESQRLSKAMSDVEKAFRNGAKYIQHSGKEINYTAEEMKKYAAAASGVTKSLDSIKPAAAGATTGLSGMLKVAAGFAVGGAVAIGIYQMAKGIAEFGIQAVKTTENINQLRGQIAAIVAANEVVKDSSGRIVNGVEKIRAVQTQVSGIFKQLQIDALKTSDTTEGLITKFSMALAPAMAKGFDLEQVRKFTVAASVSMSALKIPAQQAASEIRSILSGDELDNSQLAKGLGIFKKSDLEALGKGEKLYAALMARMKDFVTAGEEQSKTLTGVLSSLDDFQQKLQAIAGEKATEVLTKGFNDVLKMVQNADGSLTPLGNNLASLASQTGTYLGSMSNDFIEFTKWVVRSAETVDRMIKVLKFGMETGLPGMSAGPDNLGDQLSFTQQKVKVNGVTMTVGEAQRRRNEIKGWNTKTTYRGGVFGFGGQPIKAGHTPEAQRKALYQIDRVLLPLEQKFQAQQAARANETPEQAAARERARQDAIARKIFEPDSLKPPEHLGPNDVPYTYNAAPLGAGAGSGKDKKGPANDPRTAKLLREMRQELQISDANTTDKAKAYEHQIAILSRYIGLLKGIPQTVDEIDEIQHDKAMAQINRTKTLIKLDEDRKKQAREIALIEAQSKLKIGEISNDNRREDVKAQTKFEEETLKQSLERREIGIQEFYARQLALKESNIRREISIDRAGMEAEKRTMTEQLEWEKKQTGLDSDGNPRRNPGKIATLEATIKELDAKIGSLGGKERRELLLTRQQTANEMGKAIEDATSTGLNNAFDAATSAFGIKLAGAVQSSLMQGIKLGLASAPADSGIVKFFSGPNGVLANIALPVVSSVIGQIQSDLANYKSFKRSLEKSVIDANPDEVARIRQQNAANLTALDEEFVSQSSSLGYAFSNFTSAGFHGQTQEREYSAARAKLQAAGAANETKALQAEADKASEKRQANYIREVNLARATREQYLAFVKEEINQADISAERRIELEDEVAKVRQELYAKVQAKAQETQDRIVRQEEFAAQQVANTWEKHTNNILASFDKLRDAQEKALDSQFLSREIAAIYGNDSAGQIAIEKDKAAIRLKESQIVEIGNTNRNATLTQIGLQSRFGGAGVTAINNSANPLMDSRGNQFSDFGVKQFTTNAETFVQDMELLQEWISKGIEVIDKTTGRIIDSDDIENFKREYSNSGAVLSKGNADAETIRGEIARIRAGLEPKYAGLQQGATDTLTSTGMELAELQSASDPAAAKAFKLKQVDFQMSQRKKELYDKGILTELTDPGTRKGIEDNLKLIHEQLRTNVEKEFRPTESNPLPVRVVDAAPLFANPDSFYFRQRPVTVKIEPGAIQMTSGASGPDVKNALAGALQSFIPDLTREVNRENNFNNSRMTV